MSLNNLSEPLNPGWNFDNSYINLPKNFMNFVKPVPVINPNIYILNYKLAEELGLNFNNFNQDDLSLLFSGNKLPENSCSIAQAYAGHQFGYFTNLGDGRAILIGEHITPQSKRYDIQFKGSGKTAYSRNGDGRAALGPMLREYIISEAMDALKIPTSRSLAVTTTGEKIFRDKILPGAILTRVAESHIRVGTFQYAAMQDDIKILSKLLSYTIDRHYPDIKDTKNKSIELLKKIMIKQIKLVVNWLRVGFIHGVLNSDNITISGETIDYGPCAFMDFYNPSTVFSSIDYQGRYSFGNQPAIMHWNISRFAETLIPFFDSDEKKSIKIGTDIINSFNDLFNNEWLIMMKKKIGLLNQNENDEKLIKELLNLLLQEKIDYTNFFSYLSMCKFPNASFYKSLNFLKWYSKWQKRLEINTISIEQSKALMQNNNPKIIPRNHKVEEALNKVLDENDNVFFEKINNILKDPYNYKVKMTDYESPDSISSNYKTYCGT